MDANQSAETTPSSSGSGLGGAREGRLRVSPRGLLFAAATVVFLFSTWIAYTQDPRPDSFAAEPSVADWDFWRYPVERNAFRRLPVVTADLRKIFAAPDGKNLWAVGENGLIVHSADGGRHWEQQFIRS